MFLHIKTFDKQISLHSVEETEADAENDVEASPAEPLKNVVNSAMEYWSKKEKDLVVTNSDGDRLDLNKSAVENSLSENDVILVTSQKLLDEEAARKQRADELEQERKDALSKTSRKSRKGKSNTGE